MKIPKFEAQTEWVKPTEFPDLRHVDEIAIDLETKDPDLLKKGSGSVIGNGEVIGIAVATKHEIILSLIGGIFVLEALSVFAQVISFKLTGKRIFRMAPIHHHFEQKGWSEATIVIRFWIISIILALLGLASLKLR